MQIPRLAVVRGGLRSLGMTSAEGSLPILGSGMPRLYV
jgi:hypothetical protein